jgi:hypothetical protein
VIVKAFRIYVQSDFQSSEAGIANFVVIQKGEAALASVVEAELQSHLHSQIE